MLIKTSHFNKQILANLKKKDPVLYKKMTVKEVNTILRYMMRNFNRVLCKKQDIYFTNYMSCHIDKKARVRKIRANLPEI